MKNLVLGFAAAMLFGGICMVPTLAETPDGLTPAEETGCDVLLEPGVTKGLYGLCVAYCEAQDYTFDSSLPDDKLLAIYDKRKSETDPPMPCTVPQPGACPCFDQAFVDKIDGLLNEDENISISRYCGYFEAPGLGLEGYSAAEWVGNPGESAQNFASVFTLNSVKYCQGLTQELDGNQIYNTSVSIDDNQFTACDALRATAPVCTD